MSDFTMDVFFTGALSDPVALAQKWHDKILGSYIDAANNTYAGSQADVPIGETGDLAGSGSMALVDNGPGAFHVDVSYGDGQTTGTVYSYPEGDATTQYTAGGMEADGYTWFTELGHLSVAGNPVPPRPYLGPNFDVNADGLLGIGLPGLLDKA